MFDVLLQECINALFDAGFQNYKLSLLYLLNSHAQFVVKTASGITERKDIFNIVMQGTVWGTAFSVMIMNKLIKLVESNPDLLFQYKGRVPVPPLAMVDDVLSIKKFVRNLCLIIKLSLILHFLLISVQSHNLLSAN